MTTIDQNRLKGNYAQNMVVAWLSRTCLVRPVAEGTDIGIDLYCESVLGQSPYLHFWAQVKAISPSQIDIENDNEVAWFDFETRHLRYWAQQPIPVYAFLVPVRTWPPDFPKRIYGIRVTEQTIRYAIPDQSTMRLRSGGWLDTTTIDEDINQFIAEVVPWDTSALLLYKGIIAPINVSGLSGDRFPSGIGFRYLDKLIANIRDTSVIGLLEALTFEHVQPEKKQLRKRFERVATVFEDQMHDLGLSALVRAAHFDGEVDKAKRYIYEAISRIENDQTLSEDSKMNRIANIRILLADFE